MQQWYYIDAYNSAGQRCAAAPTVLHFVAPIGRLMRRFSIVVPAYNAQQTLPETLDAIAAQAYPDWECVIVNDGSSDDTLKIAQGYAERNERFRVLSQLNQGSAGAYNTGVSSAVGTFVVMCSADDILLPTHLAEVASFIDSEPGYDIYSTNGFLLKPDGSRTVVYGPDEIRASLRLSDVIRNCFFGVGATYRRELFELVDGYRLGIYGEDYDFWLRAMARGATHRYVPKPLSLHRVSAEQKSADLDSVYHSDIRIVTDLARSASLSRAELAAVNECVKMRHRAIIRLHTAQQGEKQLKVLVIPSWYPSQEHQTAGIFIHQQVSALRDHADVAVLYVREAREGLSVSTAIEDHVPVSRVQLKMPPTSRTIPGRARAVATNLYNKYWVYPRAGVAALHELCQGWDLPDIVHVQALWPAAMIARRVKRKYGIPYVVTEHSEEYLAASHRRLVKYPIVVRFMIRPLALSASRTIAVSRFLSDRLTELGLAVKPIVIPNVVPVSEAVPRSSALPHAICHVSVMGPAKNLNVLLDAVLKLRVKRSDFVLRLVGDGESRVELEAYASTLGLGDAIEFTGRKTAHEVREILGASAFSVVSSTHETFSVSAAESLMCGRPVVSTRCGGPEEFITPQVGRLVDAGGVDALVEGLDWMLDHFTEFDPVKLHEYARSRFAPDVIAAQILDVYREVLDG